MEQQPRADAAALVAGHRRRVRHRIPGRIRGQEHAPAGATFQSQVTGVGKGWPYRQGARPVAPHQGQARPPGHGGKPQRCIRGCRSRDGLRRSREKHQHHEITSRWAAQIVLLRPVGPEAPSGEQAALHLPQPPMSEAGRGGARPGSRGSDGRAAATGHRAGPSAARSEPCPSRISHRRTIAAPSVWIGGRDCPSRFVFRRDSSERAARGSPTLPHRSGTCPNAKPGAEETLEGRTGWATGTPALGERWPEKACGYNALIW
ncbi:hypothetical protein SAMN02745194_02053 [Roseomonas rosea]|uniref:Uncharacterized protein n=1 Tax=Muricoccus roseus TaxID=198092 RepID=A0A1M6HLY6_9PROT|nr:hypothetical protein SAMN02745194_02053 [Roseomonas rosea]